MDRDKFIGFYKLILMHGGYIPSNAGHAIITSYIEDEGNEYHKEHITEFLSVISLISRHYRHCLKWALDYYSNKYSVVIITQEDPNAMKGAKVITIY